MDAGRGNEAGPLGAKRAPMVLSIAKTFLGGSFSETAPFNGEQRLFNRFGGWVRGFWGKCTSLVGCQGVGQVDYASRHSKN